MYVPLLPTEIPLEREVVPVQKRPMGTVTRPHRGTTIHLMNWEL